MGTITTTNTIANASSTTFGKDNNVYSVQLSFSNWSKYQSLMTFNFPQSSIIKGGKNKHYFLSWVLFDG
jgi:hypothetical protein